MFLAVVRFGDQEPSMPTGGCRHPDGRQAVETTASRRGRWRTTAPRSGWRTATERTASYAAIGGEEASRRPLPRWPAYRGRRNSRRRCALHAELRARINAPPCPAFGLSALSQVDGNVATIDLAARGVDGALVQGGAPSTAVPHGADVQYLPSPSVRRPAQLRPAYTDLIFARVYTPLKEIGNAPSTSCGVGSWPWSKMTHGLAWARATAPPAEPGALAEQVVASGTPPTGPANPPGFVEFRPRLLQVARSAMRAYREPDVRGDHRLRAYGDAALLSIAARIGGTLGVADLAFAIDSGLRSTPRCCGRRRHRRDTACACTRRRQDASLPSAPASRG